MSLTDGFCVDALLFIVKQAKEYNNNNNNNNEGYKKKCHHCPDIHNSADMTG